MEIASHNLKKTNVIRSSGLLPVDARRIADSIIQRSVNALMTATYWEIGRRIVEFEQGGEARAAYGAQLIDRLSKDLSRRYKRGVSAKNLRQMRLFYLFFQHVEIRQTVSGELTPLGIPQTPSAEFPSAKIWQTLSAKLRGCLIFPQLLYCISYFRFVYSCK
ncbi:hypothetical protein E8240_001588 [Shigella flexneri]|nr:DUF1016 domain-containing protein [Shigella flexneri]